MYSSQVLDERREEKTAGEPLGQSKSINVSLREKRSLSKEIPGIEKETGTD